MAQSSFLESHNFLCHLYFIEMSTGKELTFVLDPNQTSSSSDYLRFETVGNLNSTSIDLLLHWNPMVKHLQGN